MSKAFSIHKYIAAALLAIAVLLLLLQAVSGSTADGLLPSAYFLQAFAVAAFSVVAWSSPRFGGWLLIVVGAILGVLDALLVGNLSSAPASDLLHSSPYLVRTGIFGLIIVAGWVLASAKNIRYHN
jgi:hypothetical protein